MITPLLNEVVLPEPPDPARLAWFTVSSFITKTGRFSSTSTRMMPVPFEA